MGTVTGLTAGKMLELADENVVGGAVVGDDLILERRDESTFNAGNVRGAAGAAGAPGTMVLPNIHLPASSFVAVNGSAPSLGVIGGGLNHGWFFDAALLEHIATAFVIPASWATMALDIWWTNNAAGGAGNVVFNADYKMVADAGNLNASNTSTGSIFAAPAALIAKKTTLIASAAVTPGDLFICAISRSGAHGSDTLANDAIIISANFRRLT